MSYATAEMLPGGGIRVTLDLKLDYVDEVVTVRLKDCIKSQEDLIRTHPRMAGAYGPKIVAAMRFVIGHLAHPDSEDWVDEDWLDKNYPKIAANRTGKRVR